MDRFAGKLGSVAGRTIACIAAAALAALFLPGCAARIGIDPAGRWDVAGSPARLDLPAEVWPRREEPVWGTGQPDGAPAIEPLDAGVAGRVLRAPVGLRARGVRGREGARGDVVEAVATGAAEWRRAYIFRSYTHKPAEETPQGVATPPPTMSYAVQTTVARLYMPDGRERARGVVVYLASLSGVGSDRALVRELAGRGWGVLVVDPAAGGTQPRNPGRLSALAITITADGPAGTVLTPHDRDLLRWVGQIVGREVDRGLAERAYAVEGVLECVLEDEPRLAEGPVALVGLSLGAIELPVLAARLRERASAAVLIAGGADVVRMSRASVLSAAVSVRFHDRPIRDSEWELVASGYWDRARLDPALTAPALARTPTLLLHANADRIVPAETGDALARALPHAERWTFRGGHVGLLWSVGRHAKEIADWVERAAAERAGREE